jgi:hypothetical protein
MYTCSTTLQAPLWSTVRRVVSYHHSCRSDKRYLDIVGAPVSCPRGPWVRPIEDGSLEGSNKPLALAMGYLTHLIIGRFLPILWRRIDRMRKLGGLQIVLQL